jgi:hypothetical protein
MALATRYVEGSDDVQLASDLFMTGHDSWLLVFFRSIFMTAVLCLRVRVYGLLWCTLRTCAAVQQP